MRSLSRCFRVDGDTYAHALDLAQCSEFCVGSLSSVAYIRTELKQSMMKMSPHLRRTCFKTVSSYFFSYSTKTAIMLKRLLVLLFAQIKIRNLFCRRVIVDYKMEVVLCKTICTKGVGNKSPLGLWLPLQHTKCAKKCHLRKLYFFC